MKTRGKKKKPAKAREPKALKEPKATEQVDPAFIAGTAPDGSLVTFWPREGEYKSYTPGETEQIARALGRRVHEVLEVVEVREVVGELSRIVIESHSPISVIPADG